MREDFFGLSQQFVHIFELFKTINDENQSVTTYKHKYLCL